MKKLTKIARRLRHNSTEVERSLWVELRNKRFAGCKFRRQEPIDMYVADFVSFEVRLIIELDGGQHNTDEGIAADKARTEYLEARGFTVLRYWNIEYVKNKQGVLEYIFQWLKENSTPSPLWGDETK